MAFLGPDPGARKDDRSPTNSESASLHTVWISNPSVNNDSTDGGSDCVLKDWPSLQDQRTLCLHRSLLESNSMPISGLRGFEGAQFIHPGAQLEQIFLVLLFIHLPFTLRRGGESGKKVDRKKHRSVHISPEGHFWGVSSGGKISAKVWGNVAVGIAYALGGMQVRFEYSTTIWSRTPLAKGYCCLPEPFRSTQLKLSMCIIKHFDTLQRYIRNI